MTMYQSNPLVDAAWCECGRMKLVRLGTRLCEPCHAIENYKNGTYVSKPSLRIQIGDQVVLSTGVEVVVEHIFRFNDDLKQPIEAIGYTYLNKPYTTSIEFVKGIAGELHSNGNGPGGNYRHRVRGVRS